MATLEVDEQEISLHENNVETNMDTLWYLDNGASNHMTGVREHFKDLEMGGKDVSGKVRFGDGSYIEIKGKGSIVIECDDKKQRIISQVYYIPDLKSNLFSLGQFTEIGCKVVMEDDELRLYDMNHKIFMKVTRQRNRLYKTNLKMGTPVCLLANLKEDTWLWHARLGHLNFESLKTMAQRNLVHGIPTIKHTTQVCDVCLIGKHNRAPFPKKTKARSTSPLDLVYGDLCGPITPPTPSGKKYIFLLVDDYSRYMWAYFLNTKDQAFDTFKEFKKSVENELRTSLRNIRRIEEENSLQMNSCNTSIYEKNQETTLEKPLRLVLRYVKGTKDYGINFKHNAENRYIGFSDSSYRIQLSERKRKLTGIVFFTTEKITNQLEYTKHNHCRLSSCVSELLTATAAGQTQALWLKRLLSKLTHSQEEKVTIQVDNKSAIALMKNPVFHGQSKHIDTKYSSSSVNALKRRPFKCEFVNENTRRQTYSKGTSKFNS
ncbi:zinc finger, CCHC-type containing protein [Tanacetum coccineum]